MINIVIPMAGDGIRFLGTEFEEPKPLIQVIPGKPMIQLVVESLIPSAEHRFIFICRRSHYEAYQLEKLFKKVAPRFEIVLVDQVTEGPACSVLLAKRWIDNDDPLMTACSDDYVNTSVDDFLKYSAENNAEGTIMTYLGANPNSSFAKINADDIITEVAEKKIISPVATVGVYYFEKGKYFVEAAEKMIRDDKRANGEFYVCPVYNEMIAQGHTIKPYSIEAKDLHGMGTPEGLRRFQSKLREFPEILS